MKYLRNLASILPVRAWGMLERLVDVKFVQLGDRLATSLASDSTAVSSFYGPGQSHQPKNPGNHFTALQIGITDSCNLVCRHCDRVPGQSKIFGTLPLPTFARYLAQFSPEWFDELLISDWGEPTLGTELVGISLPGEKNRMGKGAVYYQRHMPKRSVT